MANKTIEKTQLKNDVGEAEKQAPELAPEFHQRVTDNLDEMRSQAELAHTAYLEAQRKVARAYKARELQEVDAYKEIEQQAYKAFEEALQEALKAREKSERDAEE